MTAGARDWLRANWFIVAVPPLLLIEWLVIRGVGAQTEPMIEAVVLFDLCLFLPLLHFICYRHVLPPRQLAVRTLGLAGLGLWIATWLVPTGSQNVLGTLSWIRTAGLPLLLLTELGALLVILKMVFSGTATPEQIAERTGTPPWVAKLMLLEARFWRAVWRFIRGR